MKIKCNCVPAVLLAMVFLLLTGCGSGNGNGTGDVLNLSNQTAPRYIVSGSVTASGVGVAGVTVTLAGSGGTYTGITDASGNYTISRVLDGSYTATPTLTDYSFTPATQSIAVSGADATIGAFTAIPTPKFNVSGTVTAGGVGLAGVTLTLTGNSGVYTGTTDSSGNYIVNDVLDGTYTVTPTLVGYSFSPLDQSVVVNGANATIQNFAGTVVPPAKVYVIAKSLGSVVCINANTLQTERTINLGVSLINSIAVIGDTLWYSWGDQWSYVGRYNLSTDLNEKNVIGSIYLGLLRATPAQPGILYVGEQGLSPAKIMKYDISGSVPVLLAQTDSSMGSNLGDFKLSADGSKIWSASGAPYRIEEIRTSDMTLNGTIFDTGAYPTAVDSTTVNGSEVLVGGTNSIYDTDIHIFQASDPSITSSYETGKWSPKGNVAINANATKIYSVHTSDYLGSIGELVTVSRPSGAVSRVAITMGTTFNSGIGVDRLSGRVFVATLDSVSVFDSAGKAVGKISSIAGASTILIVAP